jgi:hypothetical protein
MAGGGKRSTIWAAMRSPTSKTPSKERVPRRRVEEALLADRLRLNDEWVERWEEGGKCVEESLAPAGLPPFIRDTLGRGKDYYDVEGHIRRLVKAGCLRPVLYFCLEQLSPKAAAVRQGRRRKSVPGEDGEFTLADERTEGRPLATREDMEAVRNKAEAARRLIHRYQRELLLVTDTKEFRLPSGMPTVPEDADDALSLLKESLSWVSGLAEAYTKPFERTLLKSKGLLYLTTYVREHADARKIRGRRDKSVDTALAGLASLVTKRAWSPSDLRAKLRKFEADHPRLHKLLVRKLDELHRFHARQ